MEKALTVCGRHTLTPLAVTGTVSRARLPLDWNNGPGPEEYYARGLAQSNVVKRLLMYGYTAGGVDIPAGDVFGLNVRFFADGSHTATLKDVPVGMSNINRNPRHQ